MLFMDDPNALTIETSIDLKTMQITIRSVRQDEDLNLHAEMKVNLGAHHRCMDEILDLHGIKSKCPTHVRGDEYYAATGNDYQGEFRTCSDVWVGEMEVLSRVEFEDHEVDNVPLRTCAWMDVCGHGGLLLAPHKKRPFYAATTEQYAIQSVDTALNKVMWSHTTMDINRNATLSMYNEKLELVVQVIGAKFGFFPIGFLEAKRVEQHTYITSWFAQPADLCTVTQEAGVTNALVCGGVRWEMRYP